MKKPRVKLCVNGCGVPPSPPSKVICRACMDAITAKLEAMAAKWERTDEEKTG